MSRDELIERYDFLVHSDEVLDMHLLLYASLPLFQQIFDLQLAQNSGKLKAFLSDSVSLRLFEGLALIKVSDLLLWALRSFEQSHLLLEWAGLGWA